MGVTLLARVAAAVGLRPSVRFWPLASRMLDQPQLKLLKRLNSRLHRSVGIQNEVPIPIPGDLRAADELLTCSDGTVIVEAYTRFVDYQAQARSAQRRKRDLGADRLVLLIAGGHANRRALRDAGSVVRESFPVPGRTALRVLADGHLPDGDAIIVL
jgi:hypothetical protein